MVLVLSLILLANPLPTSPQDTTPSSSRPSTSISTTPDSDRNSIGFLLNSAEDSDFMQEYPKSSTLSPIKGPGYSNFNSPQSGYEPWVGDSRGNSVPGSPFPGSMATEDNLDMFLANLDFEEFDRRNRELGVEDSVLRTEFIDRNVLEQRAFEIREKLRYMATSQNAPNAPSKAVMKAIEIVSAQNIVLFTRLYFRHWHRHGPMVHAPSFNPCTAAVPLVLSMMCLGGMVSSTVDSFLSIY